MFRRKNVELNLGDSDYQPAPNPNNLKPQAATGAKEPVPVPVPVQKPVQRHSQRPNTSTERFKKEAQLPTIINNYYYVQPSPQMPSQMMMPASPMVHSPQMSTGSYHQPHYAPVQDNNESQGRQYHRMSPPKSNGSRGHFPLSESNIRSSSAHSSYDQFISSAVTKATTTAFKSPSKSSASIYDSASLLGSSSGRSSNGFYPETEARLPKIAIDEYPMQPRQRSIQQQTQSMGQGQTSPRARKAPPNLQTSSSSLASLSSKNQRINLIQLISHIEQSNLTVHNDELYKLFHRYAHDDDLIDFEELQLMLSDPFHPPEKYPFSLQSTNILIDTFVPQTNAQVSPSNKYQCENRKALNFRNFIKLSHFIKGCLISFLYQDNRRKHMLTFDQFTLALKQNQMACPDELLAKIFYNSEDVDFEGFVVAIVLIRSWERKNRG